MPELGKTPIQHYRTSTAAAVPLAGNLADGEIAINRADNKIFAKNSAGTVVELAGTTNLGTAVVTTNSRSITSSTGTDVTVPVATTVVAGFMSHTDKSKLDGVAANANNYSLPEATTTVRGGIELSSDTDQSVAANAVTTTASRTYGLQLNAAGQGVVNVPWTNTTYTEITEAEVAAGTASTLRTITGRRAKYIQSNMPQYIRDVAHTLGLADAGKHIIKNGSTARTYTIPANTAIAFPIGTVVTFINANATANLSIAITTNTLRQAGSGLTGTRTIAPWGTATIIKIAATIWMISGTGVS